MIFSLAFLIVKDMRNEYEASKAVIRRFLRHAAGDNTFRDDAAATTAQVDGGRWGGVTAYKVSQGSIAESWGRPTVGCETDLLKRTVDVE